MAAETINGRRVGVSHTGSGAPMLMLHPALAHGGALAKLMEALNGLAFTVFDLPGHGKSEIDQSVDIQQQACETMVSLLEQAGGPSHVFGHSFGATVALKVAQLRPDLVRSLCLYEPVYFSLLAEANPAAYAAEAEASSDFSHAASAGDWPAAARAFLARWSAEGFDKLPPPQQAYILQTIPLIVASEPSIVAPGSGAEVLAGLSSMRVPFLLLEGEESPPVIAAINDVIAGHVPELDRHKLPGAGHMGPITHAAEVARLMAAIVA